MSQILLREPALSRGLRFSPDSGCLRWRGLGVDSGRSLGHHSAAAPVRAPAL
jgi:hypothetical protein